MKNLYSQFSKQLIRIVSRILAFLVTFGLFATTAYSQITSTIPASRCGEGPLILRAAAATGTIKWYDVPFYGTAVATGTTFTTPSLVVTKTYYVDAVDASDCSLNSGNARVQVIATVSANSIQSIIFYSSNTFCKSIAGSQDITRSGTAGGLFTVSPATGLTLNSSTGAITPATSSTGTYTVTYTVAAAEGCSENPASTTVTITDIPVTPAISYTGSPYCTTASPVLVSQTGATGGIYSASPSGLSINISTGTITPSTSLPGTYTVRYFVPGAGGCAPLSTTADIIITALPAASISYPGSPYCKSLGSAQPAILTGTGAYTGGIYTFSPSGLAISSGAVTPSTSVAGTYTVTYTVPASGNCASVTANAPVVINPVPAAAISGTTSVCQASASPNILFTGSLGTAPYSFTYDMNGGADQTVTTTVGNSSVNVAQSTLSPGTYTYTLLSVSDANGCTQSASGTAVITVNTLPVATFNYTNSPYCSNGTDPVPTYSGGGIAGTFTAEPAGLSIDASTGSIDLSASTPNTYTVTNTIGAGSGCGVVVATSSVTITKLPDATFSYASSSYCTSGTNPLPIFTEGGTTDSFTADPAELIIDPATGEVKLSESAEGVYTITRTIPAANGCLPVTSTTTLTIVSAPVQPAISYNASYCNTDETGFVTQTGTSGGTYTIEPSSGLTIRPNSGSITLAGSTPGTYTITYTLPAVGGCGSLSATANVTILLGATVNAGADQTICSGSSVNLEGSYGGATTSVTWTSLGVGSFDDATSLNAVFTPGSDDITAGLVKLVLTTNDPEGLCKAASDTVKITINQAATVNAGSDQTVCESSPTVTLNGTTGGSATSASWTGGEGIYVPGAGSLNSTYVPSSNEISAGSVTLTLTTNDPDGICNAVSDQMKITIDPQPVALAGEDQAKCGVGDFTMAGNTPASGTGTWTVSSGTATITDVHSPITGITGVPQGTSAVLSWTLVNGTCSSSDNVTITNNTVPGSVVAGTHTSSQTQIVWNWSAGNNATGYKWNTTNDYSTATDIGNVLTKTETGLECNTSYTRYVWAYSGSGCYTESITVTKSTSSCISASYTFTNAGATGNNGPTQSQVNSSYTGTSLEGKVTINTQGVQEWIVPASGDYTIDARGAMGGGDGTPGYGARMIGTISLTEGQVLKIVVGQQGILEPDYIVIYHAGGGGGGSFVYNSSSSTLLVVAGGGGGNGARYNGFGGITATNDGNTGTSGNGGVAAEGNSGAGFSGNGVLGGHAETSIAYSFLNGAAGGIGASGGGIGYGGFGGGGGDGYADGGGGGGYSGGNTAADSYGGWGGGSYNIGTNELNTAGANSGDGRVIITIGAL
jgi:hypothetical protein